MNKENLVYSFGEYDMIGNFSSLVDRFNGEITLGDMKDGFLAEAENYGINEQKALFLLEGGRNGEYKIIKLRERVIHSEDFSHKQHTWLL